MKGRRYRRRRYGRKPRYSKTKQLVTGHGPTLLEKIASGAGSVARLATAVAPIIAAVNTEAKYFDVGASLAPLSGTIQVQNLSNMANGTSDSQRIGNSILAKNIAIKYQIIGNYTSLAYNPIRMMLIADKMQNGTAPTAAEIFETTSTYLSPLNKDQSDRFVVLKDQFIDVNQTSRTSAAGKFFKKLDFHIRYKGSGAGTSDQGPNTLYLIVWTSVSVNAPTVNVYSRLNFTDN